jgi:hypothetical protein
MPKHITNRTWKTEDIETLRKLVTSGVSPSRAAIHMKRSVSSVQSKARMEGFAFPRKLDVKRERLAKEMSARAELGLPSQTEA